MKICTSCNKEVTERYVEFRCPNGKSKVVRCPECRKSARPYACSDTGFIGP